jgi:hypothetical protein
MLEITSGTIKMTWHPDSRLALLTFRADTRATGKDATLLVNALTRWIGSARTPFALLGDGKRLVGVDAEYRATWGRFLREHRDHASIAFFNMGPIVRLAAEMFRIGTGLRVKLFADEDAARSWLREGGISA